MIGRLFGNRTADLVLLFLARHGEVYATQIAEGLEIPVNMVQNQLERFERSGVIRSSLKGRRRIYGWNACYPALRPLKQLLARLNACVALDPADGSHLSIGERVELSRQLEEGAARLNPCKRPDGFTKSFESYESYEAWRKKQKNPWLI
ncbi:MAG: winged helix-turn-helix domain-containing protein [Pseudomonadota bacterium]